MDVCGAHFFQQKRQHLTARLLEECRFWHVTCNPLLSTMAAGRSLVCGALIAASQFRWTTCTLVGVLAGYQLDFLATWGWSGSVQHT